MSKEDYKYPEVQKIIQTLNDFDISFSVPPLKKYLVPAHYKNIVVHFKNRDIEIPVYDEFDDVSKENPAVLLHLVLVECEAIEEAKDFKTWVEDVGSFGDINLSRKIYTELLIIVPKIRSIIGHDVQPISCFDMQMNTGPMQTLRAWVKK